MSKERQYIAPRVSLFDEDWVFFLSSGAFRALMYLVKTAKAESSQKDPGKCPRMTAKKAAHDWRVEPGEVEEMERAAIEAEFLVIEGGFWIVTDRTIFQSDRTTQRQTAWEAENVAPEPQDETIVAEEATDEGLTEEEVTNEPEADVCPTNTAIVGQTLSMRVESRDSILGTKKESLVPPGGGSPPRKGFSKAKFEAWFESDFKPAYPKRRGGYEWHSAKTRLEALFRSRSVSVACVMEGLSRYRAAIERDGKAGTELVKQAATWVSARGWLDDYGDDGPGSTVGGPPRSPEQIEEEARVRRELLAR